MPNSYSDPAEFLADLLTRLIELLREQGGYTWDLLLKATLGRTGIIQLDGHQLELSAETNLPYCLHIKKIEAPAEQPDFISRGSDLLAILQGRSSLDREIVENRIILRAPLPDLLNIYQVLLNILADTPVNNQLRVLYREWESHWPYLETPTSPIALDKQIPEFGLYIRKIPYEIRVMEGFVKNGNGNQEA